jgi:molybdenum cofactor biosynthesis enzyme MoaA
MSGAHTDLSKHFRFPRNNDLNLRITHKCTLPFNTLSINFEGKCFLCHCEPFLPVSIGDIESFDSFESIWNHPVAKAIQQDVSDLKYTQCAVDRCGILHNNMRKPRYAIHINIDQSCNLRCPSCRKGTIMHTDGDVFDLNHRRAIHITNLLNKFDHPCDIVMSGNGDPLASLIMRPLVYDLHLKQNQNITMFTNGLMLKHHLPKSKIISSINKYQISIDAGSKEVYESVRLGGTFDSLIENLDFLRETIDSMSHESTVLLFFCCQQKNYHDMENFIDLCNKYGFKGTITKLENWYTWEGSDYLKQDVIGNVNHQEHSMAFETLTRIYDNPETRKFLHSYLQLLVENRKKSHCLGI